MEKIQVTLIDYDKLEKLVAAMFGVSNYSFIAAEESGSESGCLFRQTSAEPLDEYEVEDLAKFVEKDGNFQYRNYMLIKELVNRGVLEPANYLVTAGW